MKKNNINNDVYISNVPKVLDVEIDSEMLEHIKQSLRPLIRDVPPKGFYTIKQLVKVTHMSKSTLLRKVQDLKKIKKVEEIMCLGRDVKNRTITLPYYKFL